MRSALVPFADTRDAWVNCLNLGEMTNTHNEVKISTTITKYSKCKSLTSNNKNMYRNAGENYAQLNCCRRRRALSGRSGAAQTATDVATMKIWALLTAIDVFAVGAVNVVWHNFWAAFLFWRCVKYIRPQFMNWVPENIIYFKKLHANIL